MDLYLLAELKTISLKITTVDMKRPPADFRYIYVFFVQPLLCTVPERIITVEELISSFFLLVVWLGSLPSYWLAISVLWLAGHSRPSC